MYPQPEMAVKAAERSMVSRMKRKSSAGLGVDRGGAGERWKRRMGCGPGSDMESGARDRRVISSTLQRKDRMGRRRYTSRNPHFSRTERARHSHRPLGSVKTSPTLSLKTLRAWGTRVGWYTENYE